LVFALNYWYLPIDLEDDEDWKDLQDFRTILEQKKSKKTPFFDPCFWSDL